MHAKTRTDELLRQLSTAAVPVEDAAHAAARRERVVLRLSELVQGVPARVQRRHRLARAASIASAAILVLVAGLAITRLRQRAPLSSASTDSSAVLALEGLVQVIRPAADGVVPPLERVSVGGADEVVTAMGARARAWFASGAEVDIDPESRVRLVGDRGGSSGSAITPENGNEAVILGAGRVTLRVPKLGPRRTLAVQTPEATVVVHGTAFSVERSTLPDNGPVRTSVNVTEGSVAVRHDGTEILLHAGDHWSSESSSTRDPFANRAVDPAPLAIDQGMSRSKLSTALPRVGNRSARGVDTPEKTSSLAAENRLLQAAMAARQQGDARRAIELASELLTRFPMSPLVEEARVERMRALVATGSAPAASGEARSYLSDYPQGFARQEANRIVAGALR